MNSFGSIFPHSFQKVAMERIFALGRAQLSPLILNDNNPVGSVRLARLKKIFDGGKSLQLQFPAEDLGFRLVGQHVTCSKICLPVCCLHIVDAYMIEKAVLNFIYLSFQMIWTATSILEAKINIINQWW